jgi:hypothetical protein
MHQAASRENLRAGGAAEALSKQLVRAKVENSELSRRLNKALQAELEMRQLLAQTSHAPAPQSPSKKWHAASAMTVTMSSKAQAGSRDSSPHKGAAVRWSVDAARQSAGSGGEGELYGDGVTAAVAQATAELAAERGLVDAGHGHDSQELQKWLERSLRLQSECEAALLSKLASLVQAMGQAAKAAGREAPAARGRAGVAASAQAASAGRDMEEALQGLGQALNEHIRKKRALISSVSSTSAPRRHGGAHVSGGQAACAGSVAAIVKRQVDGMARHCQDLLKQMPILRPAEAIAAAARAYAVGQAVSRSASPCKSKPGDKLRRAGAAEVKSEIKIKDPLSSRLQRDLKEVRQKLVEQSSKHSLEVDRLKRQLSEARVEVNMMQIQQSQMQGAQSVGQAAEPGSPAREQTRELLEKCAHLSDECKQLERRVEMREAELADQRQQRLALEQRFLAGEQAAHPAPTRDVAASTAAQERSRDSLDSPAGAGGPARAAAAHQRARETVAGGQEGESPKRMTQQQLRDEVIRLRSHVYSLQIAEEDYRRSLHEQRVRIAQLSAQTRPVHQPGDTQVRQAGKTEQASAVQHAQQMVADEASHGAAQVEVARRQDAEKGAAGVDKELEQAGTLIEQAACSLEALDLTSSIQHNAQRQVQAAWDELKMLQQEQERAQQERQAQARREQQLRRDLEDLRVLHEKDADEVRALTGARAALEEQCATQGRQLDAAEQQLREALSSASQAAARADETKAELVEAVREVEQLRKAQEREHRRQLEVLGERDQVVDKLQGAVSRLEAAALSQHGARPDVQRLEEQRDQARAEVEAVKEQHLEAMEALRRQIQRNDEEHQLLHHDRQCVIEVGSRGRSSPLARAAHSPCAMPTQRSGARLEQAHGGIAQAPRHRPTTPSAACLTPCPPCGPCAHAVLVT